MSTPLERPRLIATIVALAAFVALSLTLPTTARADASGADLHVTASAPASVAFGGGVGFTYTLTNDGPETATNVVLTAKLPAGADAWFANGAGCNFTGNPFSGLECTYASLAAGDSKTVTLGAYVNELGANTSTVSVRSDTTDPDAADDNASATVDAVTAHVDRAVFLSGPSQSHIGQYVDYRLTLGNYGPDLFGENLTATVQIPSQFSTYVGVSLGSFTACDLGAGGAFSCYGGALSCQYAGNGARTVSCSIFKPQAGGFGTADLTFFAETAGTASVAATLSAIGSDGYVDTSAANDSVTLGTQLYDDPASLVVTPAQAHATAGQQACVTAAVTDASSNPVPGTKVDFTRSGSNAGAGSVATDGDGNAQYCYTGTHAGVDTVAAAVDANTAINGSATVAYAPASPAHVALAPKSSTPTVGSQQCETATVTDAYGNVTPGTGLAFSVTGANPGTGSGSAGGDGQATYCYTGTHAGADTVVARLAANSAIGDSAAVTYAAGPPAHLDLSPATSTVTVGSEQCELAAVTDAYGNATPGVGVTFTMAGADTLSASSPTDADGASTSCYVVAALPGNDTVTAVATGGNAPSATAAVTITTLPSTAGCTISAGGVLETDAGTAVFTADAKAGSTAGALRFTLHTSASRTTVVATEITNVACSADGASIFGTATADDQSTSFRVDLIAGAAASFRLRLGTGYDSTVLPLRGGNVQIRE